MMKYRIKMLGWPEIYRIAADGVETAVTDFASTKVPAILFYLAVTRKPISRERLVGLLWPDVPEKKARSSLRSALYNLQKQLPDALDVTRKTIILAADVIIDTDTAVFQTGIETDELTRVRHSVSLYAGDFLEGFHIDDAPEFEYWSLVNRERLRHQMLAALDRLINHDSAQGDTAVAIENLRRLLGLEPWREAAHRQLMLLLARQGKFNAALKQFEICRQVLAEELGAEPMPETAVLHQRIQQLRDRPPQFHLPVPDGPLLGREQELADLLHRLLEPGCRLATILGPGGVGKTRLGLSVTERAAHLFLDDACYVSLTAVSSPEQIITAVADSLGFQFSGSAPPKAQLLAHLQDRELLLMLDNAEHLLDDVAAFAADIRQQAPDVKLLITSREKLNLRAEWVFALSGLAYPEEDDGVSERQLPPADYPALQLFARRARRTRRQFQLNGETAAASRICQLLDGLPLGIELAAAQVEALTCAQIAAEIEHNLDVLAANWRDVPERHRSLRAVFDHSWRLLTPEQQAVFRNVAVFRGGFTLAAAEKVAGATAVTLSALVAKSLLKQTLPEGSGETRYDIHEVLRHYAAESLASCAELAQAAYAQHTDYYTALLSREEPAFANQAIQIVGTELDNVRAAWQWAARQRDFAAIGRAMHTLHQFYEARHWFREGEQMFGAAIAGLNRGLEATGSTPLNGEKAVIWGRLLAHHAALLWRGGKIGEALVVAQDSAAVLRQETAASTSLSTSVAPLLFTLNVLGVLHIYAGNFAAAEETFLECIAHARQIEDPLQLLKPLANLGSVYMRAGNYKAGCSVLTEGVELARQVGDRRGLGFFLNNLGAIALMQGDLDEARAHFEECLPVAEETGNKYVTAVVHLNLAEIYVKQNRLAEAERSCQKGIAIMQEMGDRINEARGKKWLGIAQHRQGKREAAWKSFRQALDLLEPDAEPTILYVLEGIAQVLAAEQRHQKAAQLLTFIKSHPSAEQQSQDAADALLAELNVKLSPGEMVAVGKRPLTEIVNEFKTPKPGTHNN